MQKKTEFKHHLEHVFVQFGQYKHYDKLLAIDHTSVTRLSQKSVHLLVPSRDLVASESSLSELSSHV